MRAVLIFILLIAPFLNSFAQDNPNSSILDSTLFYRKLSQNNQLPLKERLILAQKASEYASILKIDSTTVLNNRNLSLLYLALNDYEPFRTVNYQNLKLANKLNDTLVIAIANNNLAWYYDHNKQNDSAYYYYSKALNAYESLKDLNSQASILGNMANIQKTEKDYVGSEESIIQALKLIEQLPKTETNFNRQWILYTQLGSISRAMRQYDKSLDYHERALDVCDNMKEAYYNRLYSKNNQAYVYRKKANYIKALELYESIFNERNLREDDPWFYALILGNIAFTKFEADDRDYHNIEQMLKKAYSISDSLQDQVTKLGVTIDLAKFYNGTKQIDSSLIYAQRSYNLAKEISDNDILLEAMLLLSELRPGDEGKKYLNEHIRLSDSLLYNERSARNKFARIAFETDEIERENQRITRERMWLMILSAGLILTGFLLYIIIAQRTRNKELKFKQDQQLANEEIYNLMLSQQDKVDEARANEKKRISQELHDGILGRLFGTRLSLDSLNFSEGKEAIKTRSNYISELKTIEEDIRKISHDLNTDFVSGSGFMDIITELIEKQTQAYQLKYEFEHNEPINWEEVPNKTKINIYRIIQEALQNIYKHANANAVKISFKLKNNVICLGISDNGKGFDVNKSRKGIGLKNINSRVAELNGVVSFDSKFNKGTAITIDIPYQSN